MVIEFHILLRKFKASKKVDVVKAYLFWLLEVNLIDNPMYSTMLTPNNCQRKEDKWIVTSIQTRKTITSKNLLEI